MAVVFVVGKRCENHGMTYPIIIPTKVQKYRSCYRRRDTTFTAPTIREKLGNLTILGHDWGRAHSLKIFYNFYYDSKILYTRRLAHYAHAASDGLPTQ